MFNVCICFYRRNVSPFDSGIQNVYGPSRTESTLSTDNLVHAPSPGHKRVQEIQNPTYDSSSLQQDPKSLSFDDLNPTFLQRPQTELYEDMDGQNHIYESTGDSVFGYVNMNSLSGGNKAPKHNKGFEETNN